MVGIVTHVPALAERVPLCFRIDNGTVTREAELMRFTVDPWDAAYGSSSDGDAPASEAPVVVDVERAPADWARHHAPARYPARPAR